MGVCSSGGTYRADGGIGEDAYGFLELTLIDGGGAVATQRCVL